MARRTREEAEETRQRILDAALEVFSQKGYSRTTFVDIADRIGMTKGAVYWHFKGKRELLAAMIETVRDRVEHLVSQHVPDLETLDDLKAYFVARTRVVIEEECCRKFFFFVSLQMEWSAERLAAVRSAMDRVRAQPFARIEPVLIRAQDEGTLRPGLDLAAARDALVGMWFGLVTVELQRFGTTDTMATADLAFDALIESMRNPVPALAGNDIFGL